MSYFILIWYTFCFVPTSGDEYRLQWKSPVQNNKTNEEISIDKRLSVAGNPYEFVVAIVNLPKEQIACSGSLLTVNAILTACHCLVDYFNYYWPVDQFYAVAGSPQSVRRFEQFQVHEQCNTRLTPIPADVGLAFVETPFNLNEKLSLVRFISSNERILWKWYERILSEGLTCHIPGWVYKGNYSFQDGKMTLVDPEQCRTSACQLHRRCNMESKITCGIPHEDSPLCNRNSGGPLICNQYIFSVTSQVSDECMTYNPENTIVLRPDFFCDPLTILEFIRYHISDYAVPLKSSPRKPLSTVEPLKYPFIVSIANVTNDLKPVSLCAGLILTVSSIITTCVCLKKLSHSQNDGRYPNFAVISGIGDVFDENQFARRLGIVRLAFDCRQEEKGAIFYDLSIAFLDGKFEFTEPQVRPLTINWTNRLNFQRAIANIRRTSSKCLMATWGYSVKKPGQIRYNLLSEWEVRLKSVEQCQEALCIADRRTCQKMIASNAALCGTAYNATQRCFADTGGPLICGGYILGIVIFNGELCSPGNTVKIISIWTVHDFMKRVSGYKIPKGVMEETILSGQIRSNFALLWNYFIVVSIMLLNCAINSTE